MTRSVILSLLVGGLTLASYSEVPAQVQLPLDYTIRLPSRPAFVPRPGVSFSADVRMRGALRRGESVHAVVQLHQIPRRAEREALRVHGVDLLEAIGGVAWLATIRDSVPVDALAGRRTPAGPILGLLRWIGEFRAEDRLDPRLLDEGPAPSAVEDDGRARLAITFFDDVSRQSAEALLAGLGAETSRRSHVFVAFDVLAPPQIIIDLMKEDGVRLIEDLPLRPTVSRGMDENPNPRTRRRLHTDAVHALGVLGSGITVAMWDDWHVDASNPDLDTPGKVTTYPPGSTPELTGHHATFVAGIIAGEGDNDHPDAGTGVDHRGRGHAPGAAIVSFNIDEFSTVDAAMGYGAMLGNQSWNYGPIGWDYEKPASCPAQPVVVDSKSVCVNDSLFAFKNKQDYFGVYFGHTRDADVYAADFGFANFISAGNDRDDPSVDPTTLPNGGGLKKPDWGYVAGAEGFFTIAPPATAKNAITVGGVHGRIQDQCETVDSARFAGWGPVGNGRIKPDVVAPSVKIVSTQSMGGDGVPDTDCTGDGVPDFYCSWYGTSFSTPAVTGIAALLVEEFRARYSADPRPATVKALLVHSAQDRCTPGPDFKSGWGEIDALAAYSLVHNKLVHEGQVDDRWKIETYRIVVPSSATSLKLTLAWDDHGDLDEELNNDLDLHVQAPDGTLYFPWRSFPDNPAVPAETPQRPPVNGLPDFPLPSEAHAYLDRRNNVEKIEVVGPAAGTWLVRVVGKRLQGSPMQLYSLVADYPLEPVHVSVAHVIDRSRSMGFHRHMGIPYLRLAKDRAREFTGYMLAANEAGTQPPDQVAVVTFGVHPCVNPTESAEVKWPLGPVSQAAQDAIDASITPRGCTSIGAGIKKGLEQLRRAEFGSPRAMVLSTDGYENRSPFALDELPDPSEQIEIFTLAMGNFANEQLMQEIASATGGVFLTAPESVDLLEMYFQIQADLYGLDMVVVYSGTEPGAGPPEDEDLNGLPAGPNPSGRIDGAKARYAAVAAQDTVQRWQLPIESGVGETLFAVAWIDASADFSLDVRSPDGARIVAGENVIERHDATYHVLRVGTPVPGDWSVTLTRNDDGEVATEYTFAGFVKGSLSFWAWAPDRMLVNECLPATVEVRDGRMQHPLTGLAVHGLVRSPTQSRLRRYFDIAGATHGGGAVAQPPQDSVPRWVSTLLAAELENLENDRPSLFTFSAREARLVDEGEGPDAVAGDGVVSGCLGSATVAGSHRVKLMVSGQRADGSMFRRTRLLVSQTLPGLVDPGGTSVVAVTTPAEPDRSRVIVVPVDVFGNPLGPGLAGRISISVGAGSLLGTLRDHGDGYYSQDWQLPPSVPSARAAVQIDGIRMSSQPAFPG